MSVSVNYPSDTNPNTRLYLTFSEEDRSSETLAIKIDWAIKSNGSGIGPGVSRRLYIYDDLSNKLLGSTQIISIQDDFPMSAWEKSGTFYISLSMNDNSSGVLKLYGVSDTGDSATDPGSTTSCTWTNRESNKANAVTFNYSEYNDPSVEPEPTVVLMKYGGNDVTSIIFNGQPVTSLVYNGIKIF